MDFGYTFPTWSFVKTMSTGVDHLELRFGSGNIILQVHHPSTIHANVSLISAYWFHTKKKMGIFSQGPMLIKTKTADGTHLEYRICTKHKFCRGPYRDYKCNVYFRVFNWCHSRKFSHIFP